MTDPDAYLNGTAPNNVVEFHKNSDVIYMLEDWLRMAKRGELTSIGLVAATSDGGTMNAFAGDEQSKLIAAAWRLLKRFE